MMNISKGMVEFLRKQHPEGSRITLHSMGDDDPRPIPAGSTGTLDHIDDIGTFHVRWDNGRMLGLVPGVDDFEIRPPELKLLKLYMPMTVSYEDSREYGYDDDEEYASDDFAEMSSWEAVRHADAIQAAMIKERMFDASPAFLERGMMAYYDENDSVNRKVHSYQFDVEVRDNKLWGVAECMIYQDLTPDELATLKDEITGQASDGFGEGFEQTEIEDDGITMYAHLWSFDDSWDIKTEQERFGGEWLKDLPETCFSKLALTNEVVMLKKGEKGYFRTQLEASDATEAAALVDKYNEKLGVTKAQAAAMSAGSMFGWHVPASNPACYDENGRLKKEDRGEAEKRSGLDDMIAGARSKSEAQSLKQDLRQQDTPER